MHISCSPSAPALNGRATDECVHREGKETEACEQSLKGPKLLLVRERESCER